jgi:hypothetical protein
MERFAVGRGLELLLSLALLVMIPTVLSAGGGEDLYDGSNPDLVSDGYLTRADDNGIRLADPSSPPGLSAHEGNLLREGAQGLRSAYVTKSGKLHFTESTECNQLNPVCVGRMGIAETTGITGGELAQRGNR